ncbi:MAG: exodeoxyribonuclease VII small subunit [Clostridia bacterium]|nr:exodeoxyribonuclease VII small subunit [Clostridia bacterium]MEE1024489.1 exodeoxyribonuclease VII small subunit [Acutalibacteraceae bacterium]
MEHTFETAMKRLEEITSLLESGNLSLDDSIKLYEEGAKLSVFCDKKLKEAQLKITQLDECEEDPQ